MSDNNTKSSDTELWEQMWTLSDSPQTWEGEQLQTGLKPFGLPNIINNSSYDARVDLAVMMARKLPRSMIHQSLMATCLVTMRQIKCECESLRTGPSLRMRRWRHTVS